MADEEISELVFDWLEYTVFGMTMAISVFVGVYYGFFKTRGQNTVEGYILGEKQISLIPMATSLVASFISGIALLALGSEVYVYGTQYFISNLTFLLVGIVNIFLFVPVFYKLQIVSVYEYLEARFDHRVRKAASLVYAFYLITYIPIVIYAPALALNQVGKVNIHLITPIVCAVCIFYTSVGGLKAVVWTDVLQTALMVVSMSCVIHFGLEATGGWTASYSSAVQGGRWEWFKIHSGIGSSQTAGSAASVALFAHFLVFKKLFMQRNNTKTCDNRTQKPTLQGNKNNNMDTSLTTRMTFWTATCGMFIHWTGETAINPSFVQRLVALPSENQAKWSVVLLTFGSIAFRLLSAAVGLLAYAKYKGCDPLSTKEVKKPDQISPHFVLDVVGHVKGLPGLYMSGIFAAALSTMSGGLNTISATLYKDLILPFYKVPPSDERASSIMKRLSLSFGILSVVLILLVEKLGNILEITNSLGGSSCGVLLGIFVLGLFLPFANTKGASWGGAAGVIIGITVVAGNRYAQLTGHLVDPVKPMSVVDCPTNVTSVYGSNGHQVSEDYIFPLFKLAFQWHSVTCFLTTLLVGIFMSCFTGGNEGKTLDPNLFSPFVRKYLMKSSPVRESKQPMNGDGYASVPLQEINKA